MQWILKDILWAEIFKPQECQKHDPEGSCSKDAVSRKYYVTEYVSAEI